MPLSLSLSLFLPLLMIHRGARSLNSLIFVPISFVEYQQLISCHHHCKEREKEGEKERGRERKEKERERESIKIFYNLKKINNEPMCITSNDKRIYFFQEAAGLYPHSILKPLITSQCH